jgi:uncharacterized iron-regulated membrane protein
MNVQTDRLSRYVPPLWMTVLAAGVMASLLLGGFIVVLHDHIRHSAEVRRMFGQPAPHAGSARQVVTVAAAQGQGLLATPLR